MEPPLTLPVAWAGDGFEWCFGTIAFPSEAVDADIFLFHPWDAFSGMKEHVLAKIDIFDETRTESFERILAPNETILFRLNELLPERTGASGLYIETYHPRLIGRRNHRWRVWADVLTQRSLASLHGSDDDGSFTRSPPVHRRHCA